MDRNIEADKELENYFDIYEEGEDPYLFVSYSHEDQELVMKILGYLAEEKYRIWYDRGIAAEGEMNFVNVIEHKIKNSEGVILFISNNSMESNYCGQEILMAYKHEKAIYPLSLTGEHIKEIIPPILQCYLSDNKHISVVSNYEKDHPSLKSFLRFLPEETRQCLTRSSDNPRLLKRSKDGSRRIYLEDDIEIIGQGAFQECKRLEYIDLSCVKVIEDEAFQSCENLKDIFVPKTVKHIGEYAFRDCVRMEALTFESDYKEEIIIIGDNAFDGCINLQNVKLPNFLTELPNGLFCGCEKINHIVLPNCLVTLGESVFEGCSSLELDKVTCFPVSLKKIDDLAFADCDRLENITFPEGLRKIGKNVFKDCSNLKRVSIGKEVSYIGTSPFRGCKKLQEITVAANNKYFKSSENVLFNKNRSTLICYPANCMDEKNEKFLTKYTIPDSVTVIADWAFAECEYLNAINIPDSVDEIGENAFYKCRGISEFIIPDGVVKIDDMAFRNCTNLRKIVIPSSVTQIGWALFSGCRNIEIICERNSPISLFYEKAINRSSDFVRLNYVTEEALQDILSQKNLF